MYSLFNHVYVGTYAWQPPVWFRLCTVHHIPGLVMLNRALILPSCCEAVAFGFDLVLGDTVIKGTNCLNKDM